MFGDSSLWEDVRRTDGMKKGIYSILRGTFLISDDSFKNWRIILFISGLALIMIASAHSADKKVFEISRLGEEAKELRSMMSDMRTKLTNLKMESTIIKKVEKKGLEISTTPPQKLIIRATE